MLTAELHDGMIRIDTRYQDKDLVKQVPGARWNRNARTWQAPASWASCVTLRGVFGDQLQVGPRLAEWAWQERRSRVEPAMGLREMTALDGISDGYDADARLYAFQAAGTAFLRTAGDLLLADEPGTGKTVQVLCAMASLPTASVLPALVICPNSVKAHWGKHVERWLPEATPYVVTGTAAKRRKTLDAAAGDPRAVVIVNIESVRLFSRLAGYGSIRLARCAECAEDGDPTLKPARCEVHPKILNEIPFTTVILDEAHRVKDPKSKQTRACWAVMHQASVRRRWALTGTPIANHPGDLWSIMHGVAPLDFPTRSKFLDRYAQLSWNPWGGMDIAGIEPTTREELFRILDPRMRRMLKSVVLPQLPSKVRQVRYCEMTPKQSKAYDDLEAALVTRLGDADLLTVPNNLTLATRLLQLASSYATVNKPDPDDVTSWQLELCEPSPKVDTLLHLLDDLGDKPVVVAAEHRQLIELAAARLAEAKIPHALITGAQSEAQRATALADFSAGRVRVLLFTLKAGGVGLDMSHADTLVFLQRSWSMVDNLQAEDRVHRITSAGHASVTIIDVVTQGTIEEDQIARLHDKLARLDEITRDRQALAAAGQATDSLDAEAATLGQAFLGNRR